MDKSVQWWFGHMERMNKQYMAWWMMMMMQVGGEYKINWDVVGWMVWRWPWIAEWWWWKMRNSTRSIAIVEFSNYLLYPSMLVDSDMYVRSQYPPYQPSVLNKDVLLLDGKTVKVISLNKAWHHMIWLAYRHHCTNWAMENDITERKQSPLLSGVNVGKCWFTFLKGKHTIT